MNCLLSTLHNPKLTSPLPGVRIDEQGEVNLITPLFSCCQGEGLCFDDKANAYQRCDLTIRLQSLRQLLSLFKRSWGFVLTSQILQAYKLPAAYHPWLMAYGNQQTHKGQAFTSASPIKQPSYTLWLMALAAVWKMGFQVHVVTLGRTKADGLLPAANFSTQKPGLVLLEQKDPLWHGQAAFDFETLINWCEGALLPVWIDVLTTATDAPRADEERSLNLRLALQQKITKIKQKPSFAWLGAASSSRLHEVCSGSEQFF